MHVLAYGIVNKEWTNEWREQPMSTKKSELKCGNLTYLVSKLFADRVYTSTAVQFPYKTVCNQTKGLRRYTAAT